MGNLAKIFFGMGTLFIIVGATLAFAMMEEDFHSKAIQITDQIALLESRKKQMLEQKTMLENAHDALVSDLVAAKTEKQQSDTSAQLAIIQAQEAQQQKLLEQQRQKDLAAQKAAQQAAAKRKTRAS